MKRKNNRRKDQTAFVKEFDLERINDWNLWFNIDRFTFWTTSVFGIFQKQIQITIDTFDPI